MSVAIRLSRIGKKKRPFYRIVVTHKQNKRDGASLDIVGTYDPLEGKLLQFDKEKVEYWEKCGAIKSDSVKKIVSHIKEK